MTNINTTNETNTNKTRKIKGGKVIGSGGFGCIFKPALKCKSKKRSNKDITKLMKNKHANIEFKNIKKYKTVLKHIPNYSDYFLVNDFSLCKPDKLDEYDLKNFDKKCNALKKIDLNKSNVNSNLNKIKALNMPYGGVDIGDYVKAIRMDYKKINKMHKSLISLLQNGILPMNKSGFYHCDIKDSNVLVQENAGDPELKTRLIDWGLSSSFKNDKNIPKPLTNRPFQFNLPFSVVLFNTTFDKMYPEFLKKHKNPTYFMIRSFVINYLIVWVNKRGPGHLKSLNYIFKAFFEKGLIKDIEKQFKKDIIEFEYTFYFLIEYNTKVLFAFTKDGKFDKMEYFSLVFLKNLDLWGFVMSYLPILELLNDSYKKLCDSEMKIIESIKNIILYIIECSDKPIDNDKLIKSLEELTPLFLESEKKSKIQFKNMFPKL